MCGIVGVASESKLSNSKWIFDALEVLKHRGPDNFGSWKSDCGKIHLGHRRLSIIDLSSNGNQPMCSEDSNYIITFNGEIYNHQEIKKLLLKSNITFRTDTDTEILLKSYIKWGAKCLEYLSGMFAFCIYDKMNEKLFIARDRSGEKPFFYTFHNNEFRFASELKGLFIDTDVERKINLESFQKFLHFGFVSGENSIIDGIKKLPPGHFLEFNIKTSKISVNQFWELPSFEKSNLLDFEIENKLEKLLEDSVKLQLKSDVNVGVLLSGGTDSAIITALASRHIDKLNTYTIIFPDFPEFDESIRSKKVSKYFNTNHNVYDSSFINIDILDKLVHQFDEPLMDSSMIPSYLLTNEIKNHCKVALGGDGGDELFGGYNHYKRLLHLQKIQNLLPNKFLYLASKISDALPLGFKGKNWLRILNNDYTRSYTSISQHFTDDSLRKLINLNNFTIKNNSPNSINYFTDDIINNITKYDFKNYLLEDILVKVDRSSMLNSLELRAPFLDHNIIEFAFRTIPSHLKVDRQNQKIILKKIESRLIPFVNQSSKKGFSVPLKHWFRKGEWKDHLYETLIYNPNTIFNRNYVKKMVYDHQFLCNNSEKLYGLLFFQRWVDHYKIKF